MSRGIEAARQTVIVGALLLGIAGCVVEYDDDLPPGLEADLPVIAADDALVFERELRWWSAPEFQRVRLYRRVDGSFVVLRERWQGGAVYAWAEGSLTGAGTTRLIDALAAADPSLDEPVPGNYACTYVDSLPATMFVEVEDGDAIELRYPSLCPPEGVVDLAQLYADIVELLLDCPLDPSWYAGEPPIAQHDCQVAE